MRLSHNVPSLNIYKKYKTDLAAQAKSMKNISTGQRVNSAMDDPYAIAQDGSFNMQIRGLQMASQNAQDDISLLQTTEGGLDNMTSMLQRIRELAVQAGNGTNNDQDKNNIQQEIGQLINGIDNIAKSTNMNGVNLISSTSGTSLTTMIGSNVGENVEIPTFNLQVANLTDSSGSNALSNIDVTTSGGASTALNVVDGAISTVTEARSKYGSIENRLNTSISNGDALNLQVQTADSSVMDTDMASEMLQYSKENILVQAGTAMMAQTNRFPQQVLSILQNVR